MYIVEAIIMLVNILLAIYITSKIRVIKEINKQNLQIQSKIEKMVIDNTEIVNLLIEHFETKLEEGSEVISDTTIVINGKQMQNQAQKILYMKKQGLSVQEIAERLKIPQGEVKLKIDLHEKMNPVNFENY